MDSHLDTLYREVILDHHESPRNFGKVEGATIQHEGFNPLCGDRVCLSLLLGNEKDPTIPKIKFEGEGCAICMASASILTEESEGKAKSWILGKIQEFRDLMQGKVDPSKIEGDAAALSGVRAFPVRIKCALLPWTTLKEAFELNDESNALKVGGSP